MNDQHQLASIGISHAVSSGQSRQRPAEDPDFLYNIAPSQTTVALDEDSKTSKIIQHQSKGNEYESARENEGALRRNESNLVQTSDAKQATYEQSVKEENFLKIVKSVRRKQLNISLKSIRHNSAVRVNADKKRFSFAQISAA